MIYIKVKVVSNFYDSTAGNTLRSVGDTLEVTEERFKVLNEYKVVEKILPLDVLHDWRDFIKEHGTKRFVEYTDESDSRYAELAASGIYED